MSAEAATADAAADDGPFLLFGMPPSAWAYAARIWLAMMLALLVSFWLQLDNPASSAITVGILSQARRGEVFSKALYRALGTVLGFAASLAITALFPQARDLFLLTFAGWMALCVYCGSLFGGTQAYAFVLSGYTVAIIVVQQFDHPGAVFTFGIGRLAVVMIGIASVSVVNGVFGAPDVLSGVAAKLRTLQGETASTVARAFAGRRGDDEDGKGTGDLLVELSALREDIAALPTEQPVGVHQAEAARSAVAALCAALAAARPFERALPRAGGDDAAALAADLDAAGASGDAERLMRARFAADALEEGGLAAREIAALEAGRPPERAGAALPLHRHRREAARKALHVFVTVLGASALFVATGWPYTSQALVQVAILGCLSAIVPDETEFAKVCLVAMPLAAAIAGLTEFLVLDGVDGFPLLMIGTAPGILAACLLFCNEKTSEVGFLTVIYIPNFIEPSNPQSYDPQLYIFYSFLYTLGVVVLAVELAVVWPITPRDRRRWTLERLVVDLRAALAGRARHAASAQAHLAGDRGAQLAEVELGSEEAKARRLDATLDLSAATVVASRLAEELDGGASGDPAVDAARRALARFAPAPLAEAAEAFARRARAGDGPERDRAARLAADLRCLHHLAAARGRDLHRIEGALAP